MGWGRRRGGRRVTNPNDARFSATEIQSEINELLLTYFKPVLRRCPLGSLLEEEAGSEGITAAGKVMHETILRASPQLREHQRYLNTLPASLRQLTSVPATTITQVAVNVFLPDIKARVWAQMVPHGVELPDGVRHSTYPPREYIRGNSGFVDVETNQRVAAGGYQRDDVGSLASAIFSFRAPLVTGGQLFMPHLSDGMARGGVSVAGIAGEYAHPLRAVWILPSHPDYAAWAPWATTAYLLNHRIEYLTDLVKWLLGTCSTIGQVKRLFPEVESFIRNAEVKQRLAAAQQRSPLPEQFAKDTVYPGETPEMAKARKLTITTRVAEISNLCTRAFLTERLSDGSEIRVDSFGRAGGHFFGQIETAGNPWMDTPNYQSLLSR